MLDGVIIGTTRLESADAPMGVVSVKMQFIKPISGFNLFESFLEDKGYKNKINEIDEKDRFIDTQRIEELKVFRENGVELKGVAGNCITGMESYGFEISILGIPYPFYEQEFPHHVKDYYHRK